jgi:hypothetical protein
LLGLVLLVAVRHGQRRDPESSRDQIGATTVSDGGQTGEVSGPSRLPRERIRPATSSPLPLGDLQIAVQMRIVDLEARRASLVATARIGDATRYLFEIADPSPEEVRELRKELVAFQSRVAPDDRDNFDGSLEFLVRCHEPFGSEGPKGVMIDIPDSPNRPIDGQTFSMDDAERSSFVSALEEGSDSFAFRNYRGFHREDGRMPERFEGLFRLLDLAGQPNGE